MSIREDLKAYLDGELSQARREEVEAALAMDPALQQEVQFMRQVSQKLQGSAASPEPQGYDQTLEAVRRRMNRPRWVQWFKAAPWYGKALTVSGGVVVLLLAVGITFPLFAQSKEAAKRTAELAMAKQGIDYSLADGDVANKPAETSGTIRQQPASGKGAMGGGGGRFADATPATEDGSKLKQSRIDSEADSGLGGQGQAGRTSFAQRMVVRNSDIEVKVTDAAAAQAKALSMAERLGGYVEASGLSKDTYDVPSATATLRVPSKLFDQAMRELRGYGEVLRESITGSDVTAEYADVDARLKVMQSEEEQYRTILSKTTKIGDVLNVKARLSQVRQQIESLQAQRAALKDQALLSTISLTLTQRQSLDVPPAPGSFVEESWVTAINGLKAVGRLLAQGAIYLFVFAPVWLPIVIVAAWLMRRKK